MTKNRNSTAGLIWIRFNKVIYLNFANFALAMLGLQFVLILHTVFGSIKQMGPQPGSLGRLGILIA